MQSILQESVWIYCEMLQLLRRSMLGLCKVMLAPALAHPTAFP
jgi:hypothetical protein